MIKRFALQTHLLTALITISTISQAGTMSDASTQSTSVPYISGEGSYTWNSIHNSITNNDVAQLSKQQWGGRLAAGIVRPYINDFSFTGEFGGGYYGKVTINNPASGYKIIRNITGYDILVGALYDLKQYPHLDASLFLNVGAMVQNVKIDSQKDLTRLIPGGVFLGTINSNKYATAMLPEIKVGIISGIVKNLDISFAYMHVFGSSYNVVSTQSAVPGGVIATSENVNLLNPSLDSLMLGLRYNFVT